MSLSVRLVEPIELYSLRQRRYGNNKLCMQMRSYWCWRDPVESLPIQLVQNIKKSLEVVDDAMRL